MKTNSFMRLKQRNKIAVERAWHLGALKNPGMPVRATLNTSYDCNLNCVMCQFHRHKSISRRIIKEKGELPQDLFESFADQVFPTLIEAETTTVGEPFLSRYFNVIIAKAKEFDVKLYVTTNGNLLKEKIILDLLPVLSTLVISIDAVDPELYESIRRGSSFEKIRKNIDKFVEIRNTLEKRLRPKLTLQMTLMHSNINELPKMVQLAAEIGADHVKAYHAYIYDKIMIKESLFFHKSLTSQCIKEAHDFARKKEINVTLPRLFPSDVVKQLEIKKNDFIKPPCFFLWTESFLEPTGEISACFFPIKFTIGSITTQTFREIWNGKKAQDIRKDVQQEPPIGFCRNCELRYTYLPYYKGSGINPSQFILVNNERLKQFYL